MHYKIVRDVSAVSTVCGRRKVYAFHSVCMLNRNPFRDGELNADYVTYGGACLRMTVIQYDYMQFAATVSLLIRTFIRLVFF